jgi:hypothetical protein
MPSTQFVRGNDTSRTGVGATVIWDRQMEASINPTVSIIQDRLLDTSALGATMTRDRSGEPGVTSYLRGLAFGSPTSLDGQGSFGRHMQVGINKDVNIGNPSAPSLRLDTVGFWRFRWVVNPGSRRISALSQQQAASGSYTPSMVIKANPNIGLNFDVSASAATIAGWTSIGPLMFNATAQDVVWVELHNNNMNVPNINGSLVTYPAYFDHIVVA